MIGHLLSRDHAMASVFINRVKWPSIVFRVSYSLRFFDMEKEISEALNEIQRCNLRGATSSKQLQAFIQDYFTAATSDSSDDDEDSDDDELPDLPLVSASEVEGVAAEVLAGEAEEEEEGDGGTTDDDDVSEVPVIELDNVGPVMAEIDVVGNTANTESEKLQNFKCNCVKAKKGQCIKAFAPEFVVDYRRNMDEMSEYDKDLVLLGKISCTIDLSVMTKSSK